MRLSHTIRAGSSREKSRIPSVRTRPVIRRGAQLSTGPLRARAIYLGDEEEGWDDLRLHARTFVDHVVAEIEGLPEVGRRNQSPSRTSA
jgi:hypothetical protein